MPTIKDITAHLQQLAPLHLAESWDNVGLLIGNPAQEVERVMTCLTVTRESAAEAIAERADLIVTHHPFPFKAVKRITSETPGGRMLLDLITAGVSVYSAHTAFDSAAAGINQRLAEGLQLTEIAPLVAGNEATPALGAGRYGKLSQPERIEAIASRVKSFLHIDGLHVVGDLDRNITRMAVACGSAGEFLEHAVAAGCECFLTGETRFHTCLEAEAAGITVLLPGHYASERFALECLAADLTTAFPDLRIWPSQHEADPLRWV